MFTDLAFWEIATPLLAVVLATVLARIYDRRPKIYSWILNSGQVTLKNESGEKSIVRTLTVVLRNEGKKPAQNVRISHLNLPQFSTFPTIDMDVEHDEEGGGVITIPKMLPGERVNINYLYFPPLNVSEVHNEVRHDEGFAENVRIEPLRRFPTWFNVTVVVLVVIGFATVVNLLFRFGVLPYDLISLVR